MIYPNLLLIYKLVKIYEKIVPIVFYDTRNFAYEFNRIWGTDGRYGGKVLTESWEMASSKAKTFKRPKALGNLKSKSRLKKVFSHALMSICFVSRRKAASVLPKYL